MVLINSAIIVYLYSLWLSAVRYSGEFYSKRSLAKPLATICASYKMDRINNRNVKFVEFDTTTNWAVNLPTDNWLAIILTKSKNKNYFNEVIRKSIDRNVGFICSIGKHQDLVHEMADEEIVFRNVDIEPLFLPEHRIITTGHDDLEEGVWFGIFSAFNEECKIEEVVIINATNHEINDQLIIELITQFQSGYIPAND